jgi:hypothetical protein
MSEIVRPPLSVRLAPWLALLYYVGGFGWLIYRAATGTGIYGAVQAWEESNGHSDSFTPFLPGVILWYIPILIFDHLRAAQHPAIRAAQQFFQTISRRPMSSGATIRGNRNNQDFGHRAMRMGNIMALVTFGLGVFGAGLIQIIGSEGAGQPIPQLTIAQLLAANPQTLPAYIHLTGATPHPELAWVNSYTIRNSNYADYYIPRTPPDWVSTNMAPVNVIELDMFGPDTSADVEGELSVNSLDPWMPGLIAKMGWTVAPTVYVVKTNPDLNGVLPGPDRLSQSMLLFSTGFGAIVVWSAAFNLRRRWLKERNTFEEGYRNPYGDR